MVSRREGGESRGNSSNHAQNDEVEFHNKDDLAGCVEGSGAGVERVKTDKSGVGGETGK